MIGLWLENGQLTLNTTLPDPVPLVNEALVRVVGAGICNTDLELIRGYYPYTGVLGNEFVGVVEQAPTGFEHLEGHRVVGEIIAACGNCNACDAGRETHCENRTVLGILARNGAFAEYLTLPARNLHTLPDSVPNEVAVFTEPLAAALQIQAQITVHPANRVLVVGDGKLGQLIARSLQQTGCYLCVAGRHKNKLAMLSNLAINTFLVDRQTSVNPDPINQLLNFDVAIECTGNTEGFEFALRALRPRGTLVLKSTYADRLTLDISSLVVDEITLVGSRCGPFKSAIKLLRDGTVPVKELITDRYPLAAALTAFDRAQQPGTLKVLLQIS